MKHSSLRLVFISLLAAQAAPHATWAQVKAAPPLSGVKGKLQSFTGSSLDRDREAEQVFQQLSDRYERLYYAGIAQERRAKAQLRAGQPPYAVLPLFELAMRAFEEAEKIRPTGNDDAILRWNRCARLLQTSSYVWEQELAPFEKQDTPPT